jgi:hypothetical protein
MGLRKIKKSIVKQPPIVIVPDKSYIDDEGYLIPTNVIILTHEEYHEKFISTLRSEFGSRKDIIRGKLRTKNEKSKRRTNSRNSQ